jgi:hypothetical protein
MHATSPALPAPAVSAEEIDRFRQAADIQDEQRFRQLLNELLAARIAPDTEPERLSTPQERAALVERMRARPEAQPVKRWQPTAAQRQHGRVLMLAEFNQPHNLPLLRYAELAGVSRQQIYKQIKGKKLLALSAGGHGVRIPDWQLDPAPARLTQAVWAKASEIDVGPWVVYDALTRRSDRFGGKSPVEAARSGNLDELATSVLDMLRIHP